MAPAKALEQLALQKRLLLAESEAQRLILASALHRATSPLKWVSRVQSQTRPVMTVVLPLVGFWVARRSRGMKRWVSTGLGALRIAKSLRGYLHKPS